MTEVPLKENITRKIPGLINTTD